MRFDIVINAVYLAVDSAVSALLADAGVDAHNNKIDEIVYVGETTCLPENFKKLILTVIKNLADKTQFYPNRN